MVDTMETGKIQERAAEAYDWFETATREDGQPYVRVKDGAPGWMADFVREAHGTEFLPDDWRYDKIQDACLWISEADDPEDGASEFADGAVDVYTADRIAWLGSNLRRAGYCDEAAAEYGQDTATDIIAMIGLGQYAEALEVYELTLSALQDLAD